jgi:hypothetical protein
MVGNCQCTGGECYQDGMLEDGGLSGNRKSYGRNDSLLGFIMLDSVRGLNEHASGMTRKVLKPAHCRHDQSIFVENEGDDAQLIIHIPFTCCVKITSIALACGPYPEAPSSIKAFVNKEDIDFSNVDTIKPIQEWSIAPEYADGRVISYPTRQSRFSNVDHLTLYIDKDGGQAGILRLFYLAIHGIVTRLKQDQPVIAVYEARANLSDHPVFSTRQVHYDTAQ